MFSDNYLYEKDKLIDDENVFTEKKIFEVNDTNAGSYSANNNVVKYQLSQIFNLNTLMNFSNAYLFIPLDLKITNFKLVNPADALKLFSLKPSALFNSISIRINGKNVVNYSSNLGELMEFNFLTKATKNNLANYERAFFSETDERLLEFLDNQIVVNNNSTSENLANRAKLVSDKLKNVVSIQSNKLFVDNTTDGVFNKVDSNPTNTRLSCVTSLTGVDTVMRFNLYLKLTDLHPVFSELNIARCLLDMEIGINCGKCDVKYTSAGFDLKSKMASAVQTNTFSGNSNPIYFNVDAINYADKKYYDNNSSGAAADITFNFDLSINSSEGTKIYMPMLTLKPAINEIYIKDSVKKINFLDYNYFNLNNIAKDNMVNFTLSNSVLNQKYLLIIPQLTKNKMSLYNSSVLNNGPIPLTNIQIVKGSSVFNQPLVYTYDMFLNYINNNNNVNGGNDWNINIFNENAFVKTNRLYFFDLTLINNEKDVGYNLIVQLKNSCQLSINIDFYVLYENEFMFNKLNGTIGTL
jgi:hypothetical protein